MKILLSVAVLAIVLASCTKKQSVNTPPAHVAAITISNVSDPKDTTIKVGEFAKLGVPALRIKIVAQQDVTIGDLFVTLNGSTDASNILTDVRIYSVATTMQLDSQNIPAGTPTVRFANFLGGAIAMKKGDTKMFDITLDTRTIDGTTFTSGSSITVGVTKANVGMIAAYDSTGARLKSDDLAGSAEGGKITFTE